MIVEVPLQIVEAAAVAVPPTLGVVTVIETVPLEEDVQAPLETTAL
jgi:hypothetical protein